MAIRDVVVPCWNEWLWSWRHVNARYIIAHSTGDKTEAVHYPLARARPRNRDIVTTSKPLFHATITTRQK